MLNGEGCKVSAVVLSGVFGNWKYGSNSGISGWNFGSISVSGSSLGSSSGIVGNVVTGFLISGGGALVQV